MRRLQAWLGVTVVVVGCVVPRLAAAETREFTVVNIEFEGSKIWLPSTLHVKKGDVVKVKLTNLEPIRALRIATRSQLRSERCWSLSS